MTPKQEAFVREYLIDLNATAAYKRAGYAAKGHAAESAAERLLRNVEVQSAVSKAQRSRANRLEITADRVLQELARIAFFDPRKLLREDGTPKPLHELDDDCAAAVAGLDILEEFEGTGDERTLVGHVKKYKIADKNVALTNAMKHLGMLREKVEITGDLTLVERLRRAEARLKP